jgi:DNA-binding NtrC family response regulator
MPRSRRVESSARSATWAIVPVPIETGDVHRMYGKVHFMIMSERRLRDTDRAFFSLVANAAFSNPFGDERAELDRKMARSYEAPEGGPDLPRVLGHLDARLGAIDLGKRDGLGAYAPPDRALLENAVLFQVFHEYTDALDELIVRQLRAGATLSPAPFGKRMMADLASYGWDAESAARFVGIFFQMRRAFFFIERGLTGRSLSMRRLRERLWNNVFTHDVRVYERYLSARMEDFSTILLGETGSGKGTAAAAIGRSGFIPFDPGKDRFVESFTRAFVTMNLSQYPESLIESELFGHRKGAFTGAIESHEGLFERCSPHGAIFLDEIGEISAPVQIKLLDVLQERRYTPVGSHESKRFEGRVIAATNRSLAALREAGAFRHDFYYRLCSDVIEVPPLRVRLAERPEEMNDLLEHVVERIVGEKSEELVRVASLAISAGVGDGYPWPGNVREVEQAVRRILMTAAYEPGPRAAARDLGDRLLASIEEGTLDAHEMLAMYCALLYRRHGTYEEVARRTKLDRRTVKKYVIEASDRR